MVTTRRGPLNVSVRPLGSWNGQSAKLMLVHDMNFVDRRNEETRRYLFYFFLALAACVALITVVIVQLSWRGWVSGLRALLRGEGIVRRTGTATAPELQPIARDVTQLLRELEHLYRPTDENQQRWTKETLRATLRGELRGNDIIVVSNREPYVHESEGVTIRVRRPASGLVTALEPVMRACSGTWIAHGSGSADRDTVDSRTGSTSRPDHPLYRIRRIWLTRRGRGGLLLGLFQRRIVAALSHRPRSSDLSRSDWDCYQRINARFADAVVREASSDDPIVLVQDYHFALLPRMIRDRLPQGDCHYRSGIYLGPILRPSPSVHGARDTRRSARQQHLGLPYAISTATTSWIRSTVFSRRASIASSSTSPSEGGHRGSAVSNFDRMAATKR